MMYATLCCCHSLRPIEKASWGGGIDHRLCSKSGRPLKPHQVYRRRVENEK